MKRVPDKSPIIRLTRVSQKVEIKVRLYTVYAVHQPQSPIVHHIQSQIRNINEWEHFGVKLEQRLS